MGRQQHLFEDDDAPWDFDDEVTQTVVAVVIPTGPPRELDYRVPPELAGRVEVGMRIRVPLGRNNRPVIGYCVRLESRQAARPVLKPVTGVVDSTSLLSPAMVRLTRWMADEYLCDWASVLEAVVPAAVKEQAGTRRVVLLRLAPEATQEETLRGLSEKQREVVNALAAAGGPLSAIDLARRAGCTTGPILALRKRGLLLAQAERQSTEQTATVSAPAGLDHPLNEPQRQALEAILAALRSATHQTLLLRGVTGSGKTEVYIRAIQEVASYGRQAIVLVPEISLTPQTQDRFRARFGKVAVLHSHLSDAQRHWEWQRIARGEAHVVIGARSAIFAPVPHLGLIVLDEEHEGTFKQDNLPRYHARDVAIARAAAEQVPLVLGSATPSLESWQRRKLASTACSTCRAACWRGPCRQWPRSICGPRIVDVTPSALSRPLIGAMHEALAEDGQIILLLNRRGYSTHIQCPACGEVVRCPHCDLALTHHRHSQEAICHRCDHKAPAPPRCPACEFSGIRYSGLGTQRLEAEVRTRFPDVQTLRMDTDSMRQAGSHERALTAFREGEVRILVGTQMIAKGLDFPNVTLVGVVNADTALHLPDFRAAERTFQLLVQVAGRTGRGDRGGRVLVQTFTPDHAAIRAATRHDYPAFADHELAIRRELGYPPFTRQARLIVRGPAEVLVAETAAELGRRINEEATREVVEIRRLGPAPAPIPRLRGNYRYHLQVQAADGVGLRRILAAVQTAVPSTPEAQWIIDMDPLEML